VRTVWETLASEFADLKDYEVSISTAVNAEYSRMDAPVADGDEVAFLPPVSGG
ncbi:MAG TPA: MoaD/ThiS family protein, partial [Acidobacteria bacterium]|nr:MoaD/ThiS family protein [Acidobacteriota bacterium]